MPLCPREAQHYGVAAIGSAGRFTVEILETTDNRPPELMSIEAGSWSLCFRIWLNMRCTGLSFLREHAGRVVFSDWLSVPFLGAPVVLIKDDEFLQDSISEHLQMVTCWSLCSRPTLSQNLLTQCTGGS